MTSNCINCILSVCLDVVGCTFHCIYNCLDKVDILFDDGSFCNQHRLWVTAVDIVECAYLFDNGGFACDGGYGWLGCNNVVNCVFAV